jgi:hypothetical protein
MKSLKKLLYRLFVQRRATVSGYHWFSDFRYWE